MSSHPSPPPHAVLLQVLTGKWLASAISAAAKFGIADLLEHGPKTIAELAAATKTNEQALYRLLRTCASIGIFAEQADGSFANTPLSEPLRTNAVPCVRNLAMMFGADWHVRAWAELPWSVETGKPAPYKLFGTSGFEWMSHHPEDAALFNKAMMDLSQADAPVIAASYDYSRFKTLVDIAGGLGTLLLQILNHAPALHGIVFEMPHVVEQIKKENTLANAGGRCEAVAGSFFESVPPADGYIMKHILHDWDEESSEKILKICHKSIAAGGRLLIVDQVVPLGNTPSFSKVMDLEMLVAPGGRERTENEWAELLKRSGFKMERIIATPIPQSIIEASPA